MSDRLLELAKMCAAKCEAAKEPSADIDRTIRFVLGLPNLPRLKYSRSLDAAVTLIPEGMAWWLYHYGLNAPAQATVAPASGNSDYPFKLGSDACARTCCATPALALCAAALRARAHG